MQDNHYGNYDGSVYRNDDISFFPEEDFLREIFHASEESKKLQLEIKISLRPDFGLLITYSVRFGFFVEWHINLCRLFNAKAILREEQ